MSKKKNKTNETSTWDAKSLVDSLKQFAGEYGEKMNQVESEYQKAADSVSQLNHDSYAELHKAFSQARLGDKGFRGDLYDFWKANYAELETKYKAKTDVGQVYIDEITADKIYQQTQTELKSMTDSWNQKAEALLKEGKANLENQSYPEVGVDTYHPYVGNDNLSSWYNSETHKVELGKVDQDVPSWYVPQGTVGTVFAQSQQLREGTYFTITGDEYEKLKANQKPEEWSDDLVLIDINKLVASLLSGKMGMSEQEWYKRNKENGFLDEQFEMWDKTYESILKFRPNDK